MRLSIYARDFPESGTGFIGGLDKAVYGLASGLVENGAQVTVLCNGASVGSRVAPEGFTIRSFGKVKHKGISLPHELIAYIDNHADPSSVFLLNGVFNPSVYIVSRACRRNGIPYVFWPHDPYHTSLFARKKMVKWIYWSLLERRLLRSAAAIQVLSALQQRWLAELDIRTPTLEIMNGYAPEDVLPESMLAWRTDGVPKFLFLGRIDYYNKALDLLIDAFGQVTSQQEARLTLQGPDWGDRALMMKRARSLGMNDDRVEFKSPDYSKSAAQIMTQYDAFLLPSRFEGFSLAALEAMCVGRVLMVSKVNGIARYVEDAGCGVVVEPEVESIANGLRELLRRRSEWCAMGQRGRDYALRTFQWKAIAKDALSFYERLLDVRS